MNSQHTTEFNIRPQFKHKFRSAEARPLIEKVVNDALAARDHSDLAKTIADKCKEALKDLKKDARYKFM